jgi:hypothetical protein
MKKIFTMAATLLVAMSMNAQNFTEEVVVNNPDLSSDNSNTWVHEYRLDESGAPSKEQTEGPALIEDGAAKVYVRSFEQAMEAGNATLASQPAEGEDPTVDNFADWDSQFFITWAAEQATKVGDKIQIKLKAKADVPQAVATQCHRNPGNYIDYRAMGDLAVTEEWQEFASDVIDVVEGGADGKIPAETYTIAFNLAKGGANTVYFKDFEVTIWRTDYVPVVNENELALTLIAKEHLTADEYWGPARTDEEGNATVYIRSKEEALEAGVAESDWVEWDSQFFITWPAKDALKDGDKIRLTMNIKADVAESYGVQCHQAPGTYYHYFAVPNPSFTTSWEAYDSGEIPVTTDGRWDQIKAGTYSFAFNLSKGGANNLYFNDVHVWLIRDVGTTTEVRDLLVNNKVSAESYNLAGQKVDASYKGIVIRDGKKFIQK